ncbi:Ig-like domain-containing protein [Cellvibrio japonicus]|uniref:Big-1 domain-containing protein n=1 Tax=Cellvibrio japonicus (strain Ueda107) TaxID=498211 RepID=B3PIV1_CELJU|nr:Ig-like domain-containing protein [Cellvibrio japonicus]ACE84839.1 conserved hypothetical protein [Cellvibrio japonicus Ueda107]QEI11162.1 hypothetical protein FY117_02230 [Cellvibrio japonicus]QEI14736.1 hypothetical protein FY116_02230 [Cellvibrio japonicus]QEI18316.1 hypothetical protein FY115_02230 [Cellvibrio japonicus]
MQIQTTTKLISAALLSLLISACGGGDSSPLDGYKSSTGNSSTGSDTNTSGSSSFSSVDSVTARKIGFGSGTSFVNGQIGIGILSETLSAGGSTTLTVNIVSDTNTLVTSNIAVRFNSKCVAAGEAVLTDQLGVAAQTVTSTSGEATIVYTAKGCVGPDLITATATIDQVTKEAQTTINVEQGTVGSIKFVDATPSLVGIAGTGGQETSVVRFQVLSNNNNQDPIKDVDVEFSLSNTTGGITLSTAASKTDRQGYATTTVKSGTVHTSVRVTARTGSISTQSDRLVISTGIPDQDSFSLGATVTNPVGFDIQGVESTITARLGDAFNNPPPEGTTIAFTAEGGSIDDSCNTNTAGACTVVWRSQNPQIQRDSSDYSVNRLLCVNDSGFSLQGTELAICRKERAGRTTILATAVGNESYIDGDGSGRFDNTQRDIFSKENSNCSLNAPLSTSQIPTGSDLVPCDDLAEAYLDKNENGIRDANEEFIDFNNNQEYDPSNGMYNGILCSEESAAQGTCSKAQVTIRQDLVLVVTSHNLLFDNTTGRLPFIDQNILVPAGGSGATWFWLADKNGNGVPQGTELSLDTSGLKNATATISPKGPFTAMDDPQQISISVIANDEGSPAGQIGVRVSIKAPQPVGDIIYERTISVNQLNLQ